MSWGNKKNMNNGAAIFGGTSLPIGAHHQIVWKPDTVDGVEPLF